MADDEPPPPPNSGTRALRLALDAHRREVNERVGRIEAAVGDVTKAVAKLTKDPAAQPPSWHWDDLDDVEADDRWQLLGAWVEKVLRRWHPRAAASLRPCWAQHPPAVAAVTAAWLAWEGAYRGEQRRSTDPAAWLRDWLPALTTQLATELGEPRRDVLGDVDLADTTPCALHNQEPTDG